MILLWIDTQKGCFNEELYLFERVKENIKKLIAIARENNVEVAYVQHDDGPGTDLDKSTDSYEIYEEFAPRIGEKRFEKNVNSAFHPMVIQINMDEEMWVSDSPYIHAFDGLDEIHHQMESDVLNEKMKEIGYGLILNDTKNLPNGKALVRLDYQRVS